MSTIVPPIAVKVPGSEPHLRNRDSLRMGWVRDLPDQRDHLYSATSAVTAQLPQQVDLRAQCPPVYDQGDLGSCTANATAGLFEFVAMKEGFGTVQPSRLFIYYNERVIENTVNSDSGAQLRDGIKTVAKQGVCKEEEDPYIVTQFTNKPSAQAYADAKQSRAVEYMRITQVLSQLQGCLAQGYPFVFGFTVYSSFMSEDVAKTGVATLPQAGDQVEGGHAVMAVGYNNANQTFLIRNSWGDSWGQAGYFTFPYAYLTDANLSSDFWTIRQVSAAAKVPQ
jgi:C1A family cysteine protease